MLIASEACRLLCNYARSETTGAECYYDEDCEGPFARRGVRSDAEERILDSRSVAARCLQRVCRRALLTHQVCDAANPNDLCDLRQRQRADL